MLIGELCETDVVSLICMTKFNDGQSFAKETTKETDLAATYASINHSIILLCGKTNTYVYNARITQVQPIKTAERLGSLSVVTHVQISSIGGKLAF